MIVRIIKWFLLVIVAVCLLALVGYGAYLKRDELSIWTGQAKPPVELSPTPLFKPLEKFIISMDGSGKSSYLVLELALVTHNPAQLDTFESISPLLRNVVVQYFSHRTRDDIRNEFRDIGALQESLLGKLVTTMQGYGYDTFLDEVLVTKVLMQ
ncbi:MAG: flagellar basal body-associated FliL family protein [Aeromonas sp.]